MTDAAVDLTSEQEPQALPRRHLWRWFGGALLLFAFLGADVAWRNIELDRVVDEVEATKLAVDGFNTDVGKAFEAYFHVATRTPEQETDLLRAVGLVGSDRATELAGVREEAAELFVVPWHGSVQEAKRASLAYIDAYVARLRDVSRDPRAIYPDHFIERNVEATSRIAYRALRDSVPPVAFGWFRFRNRIDEALYPEATRPAPRR